MQARKAVSEADIRAVWRLTHDAYVASHYADPQPGGMLQHYPHLDQIPETSVFIVEDAFGRVLGSNSLTLDGPAGLHVDDDFKETVDDVRRECRRKGWNLGASWRIATHPECRNHLDVILPLIQATVEEGKRYPLDVTLYTFNPKHERFYRRMLGLETIAGPLAGHSVKGAPAILMRGNLEALLKAWNRVLRCRARANRRAPRPQPAPAPAREVELALHGGRVMVEA